MPMPNPVDTEFIKRLLVERFDFEQLNETNSSVIQIRDRCTTELHWLGLQAERILFVTEEGDVGSLYHPEPLDAVVVGLFKKNFPFVLRPLSRKAGGKQLNTMVNVAYIMGHGHGNGFASPRPSWQDLQDFGLREYTIV